MAQTRSGQIGDLSYELQFSIPESAQDRISGQEKIRFDLRDDTRPVVLDAQTAGPNPLALESLTVNSRGLPALVARDHIEIPASVLRKGRNTVSVAFVAGDAGLRRREDFLYTLFVPDNASKTFPCFDQPDLKARFELTLRVPKDWAAISQGPIGSGSADGDFKTLRFRRSRPTSTYLFAFAAGRFQAVTRTVDGREMTMYHRETDRAKVTRNASAIFELHARALRWLERYTGIKYPFGKFDFVLLPAFPFGGMEHPGSIFYNDKLLFLDPSATQTQLLGRAIVISHETSHMWFGDLVTMRWFDDVWLKEVFANFMADKIASPLFPGIDHDLRFLLAHYPQAYSVDRTAGSNPIEQELGNLEDASTLYGDIIYHKAPIAMRQLEKLVGARQFRDGLREYLHRFEYANATWSQLMGILGKRMKGSPEAWDRIWIGGAGRPRLSASLARDGDGPRIEVKSADPGGRDRIWPQTLELAIGNGGKALRLPVLADQALLRALPPDEVRSADYILTTAQDPGYGLFFLDNASIAYLKKHLSEIRDPGIRAVAWIDLWENMLERRLSPEDFVDLSLKALPSETEELTIDYILGQLKYSYWALASASFREKASADLERALWEQVLSDRSSALARTSYFKAYVALFTGDEAWKKVHDIWAGRTRLPGIRLSEPDFMDMAYALALRKGSEAPAIFDEQLRRLKDPERKKEFQFVFAATAASEKGRDAFFSQLMEDNGRKNEPWVRDALYYLHHPIHGTSSEKYIAPSLELLPRIKQTGGIFFPKDWLAGTLGFHVTPGARKTVERYLKSHPELPEGLRLKVLQSSDVLQRFAGLL